MSLCEMNSVENGHLRTCYTRTPVSNSFICIDIYMKCTSVFKRMHVGADSHIKRKSIIRDICINEQYVKLMPICTDLYVTVL